MYGTVKTDTLTVTVKSYTEGYHFKGHVKDLNEEFSKSITRYNLVKDSEATSPRAYMLAAHLKRKCDIIAEFLIRANWKWNPDTDMFEPTK